MVIGQIEKFINVRPGSVEKGVSDGGLESLSTGFPFSLDHL